jgi:hypothetical protein
MMSALAVVGKRKGTNLREKHHEQRTHPPVYQNTTRDSATRVSTPSHGEMALTLAARGFGARCTGRRCRLRDRKGGAELVWGWV